ncbi:MAG: carbohydrate porin [Rhodanobacteraceae bacterium]|nr:MAG: carbohydrate porin [Rhodanobacteraceae bacterium]
MTLKPIALALALASAASVYAARAQAQPTATASADTRSVSQQIAAMQTEIDAMQARLNALKARATAQQAEPPVTAQPAPAPHAKGAAKPASGATSGSNRYAAAKAPAPKKRKEGITVGGAVRFQYSYEGYNPGNVRRAGDVDYDLFRLDLHGTVHGITLDAQWRWFQYMSAIQHAWVGYAFNERSQVQVGLTRIPFGNQPYDSHSYFFSSNYYLGLEDTYAAGVEYVYAGDPWNVQLAFFKNDGTGGVDGSNRTHSYSYDVVGVRAPGEGIYATPSHPAGAADTVAARVARTYKPAPGLAVEVGASGLYGGLDGPASRIGHYHAAAVHANVKYQRWNLQVQAARYAYTTDSGANRLAVGAYAFYDTIAARADSYTVNLAYRLPVRWGPVSALDFYNDYSLVIHKSGALPGTFMDVLGVGVSAGDLYTYFDFVTARNQPFIGGSMAGNGRIEHRFNINFGFYF